MRKKQFCAMTAMTGAITLCLLLAAGAVLSCSGHEQPKTIPPELTGVWESSEKKYEGCQLEIRSVSLRFHGIDGAENDYYLLGAEAAGPESSGGFESAVGVRRPKGNLYILHCRDTHDETWDFHLIHTSGTRESLTFKNRAGKWYRG